MFENDTKFKLTNLAVQVTEDITACDKRLIVLFDQLAFLSPNTARRAEKSFGSRAFAALMLFVSREQLNGKSIMQVALENDQDPLDSIADSSHFVVMTKNQVGHPFAFRIEDMRGESVAVVQLEEDIDRVINAHGKLTTSCSVYAVYPNGDEYVFRSPFKKR